MRRNPATATLNGAIAGVLIALGCVAWFGGYLGIDTVEAVTSIPNTPAAEPQFVATANSLWLMLFLLGAAGGLIVATISYGVGRVVDPEADAFPAGWLLLLGTVLGAVVAFSTVRLGVTIWGDLEADIMSVPVATFILIAAVAGLLGGAIIAPIVDALARPATMGPRNEATPISSRAFWMDLGGAIGVPLLAVAIGAIVAISLAQLLLSVDSNIVAVVIFSVFAALVLGLAALLAYRPWDRSSGNSTG